MESHNNKNTKYNFDREYITILFEDVGGVGRNVLSEDCEKAKFSLFIVVRKKRISKAETLVLL